MNLITTFYHSENNQRNNEIQKCLISNNNNSYIKKIYLLNDKMYPLHFIQDKTKIVQIEVDDKNKDRLMFSYAFHFINNNLSGEPCILSNSDIIFDNTLSLFNNYNWNNKFLALSRYNDFARKQLALQYSQDAWLFMSPCKIPLGKCNFTLGKMGCDGRIAYLAHDSGYHLLNPALSIYSYHVHESNFRTYKINDRVEKPYIWVYASRLNQQCLLKIKTNKDLMPINNN